MPLQASGIYVAVAADQWVGRGSGATATERTLGPARPAERAPPTCFPEHERAFLLAQPGVGIVMVRRLEQAGYHSMQAIRRLGVNAVVAEISAALGTKSWANRTGALKRAIGADISCLVISSTAIPKR
jgi:hypothetical protein